MHLQIRLLIPDNFWDNLVEEVSFLQPAPPREPGAMTSRRLLRFFHREDRKAERLCVPTADLLVRVVDLREGEQVIKRPPMRMK